MVRAFAPETLDSAANTALQGNTSWCIVALWQHDRSKSGLFVRCDKVSTILGNDSKRAVLRIEVIVRDALWISPLEFLLKGVDMVHQPEHLPVEEFG